MNLSAELKELIEAGSAKAEKPQKIPMLGLENAVTGQKIFMPDEELVAYLRSGAAYFASLRPVGYSEEQLVQKIVDANWWLNRSSALDTNLLSAKRLENSAASGRTTDMQTDSMMSLAMGFRDECSGPNTFEILGKCATRTARLLVQMAHELERAQETRIERAAATFDLAACKPHAWYLQQIGAIEVTAMKNKRDVRRPAMSQTAVHAAAEEFLELAEKLDVLDPADAVILKRLTAQGS